jgi:regulation of enolase protein 1 (concanavalin A-like superfamily)
MRREVNVFGDGTETEALVGVMAASPKGGDAKTTFKNFKLSA